MLRKSFVLMVMGTVIFFLCSISSADVPDSINYQGKLTTANGGCMNDTVQMTFTIYSDELGVSDEWSETQTEVVVKEGIFSVFLGSVNPLPVTLFDGSVKYLGVQVESDQEMRPLKPMVSVAYAYKSFETDTADYARVSMPDADWTIVGDTIYHLNGNVGIGKTSPNEQLEITGNLRLPATTATVGMIKLGADRFIHNYGTENTFVGHNAGNLTMTGYSNTATGYAALSFNTEGLGNTANGDWALLYNTTGSSNTAVGYGALFSNTTGYNNTANGSGALYSNTTGDFNTANGVSALHSNTTGYQNTANGYQALYSNTTGYQNTANGRDALSSNTTGYHNTANGYQALNSNTIGYFNTANGTQALQYNTEGYSNTANGYVALFYNTTGYSNTANGNGALYYNTTGDFNTAIGQWALFYDTTQSNNTAVGSSAGDYNTSTNSTFLGTSAYPNASGYDNSMCLGYGSRITASNQVRVGNSSVTSIGGQVGWTTLSDGRYKKSTSENVPGLSFISKLKPVTYTLDMDAIDAVLNPPRQLREGQSQEDLNPSAEEMASKQAQSQIVYTGFIAQEVEQAAKETGYDFSGVDAPKSDKGMYGLRYAEFVVPLVKAVQEQQRMIQEQQVTIQELQKRVEELEKK